MQIKHHLVTTADERTWKFDRKVIFLGEWCRLYERRNIWREMDAEVAQPFGLQAEQKKTDLCYLQVLSAQLLIELTDALNAFHDINHTPRYWNILLGHWLQRYVHVCFNRFFTIEQAFKKYKINSTTVLCSEDYSLATPDSSIFISASNDDVWNNVLYARAIKYMDCNDVSLELVNIKCANNFEQERKYISTHCLSSAKLIKAVGRYILPRLSKSNDAFIINSYLPKLQEIKLQLALLQCPQLWESPKLNSMHFDIEMRKKFKVESVCYTGFEQFVRDLLTDTIPICFLEGYSNLQQQVKSLQWPSKPKFIFTSNNFDTDEIFKAWVGQKVEQEIPYFTGQHGNYQAYPALLNAPEMVSSDKFFTWGWSSESMKNIPAFIFKIANRPRHTTPDGGLLLIELHAPHLLNATDCYYEFGVYQEQQFRFVEALPEKIQKELTVRLHGSWHNTRWSDDKRWNDRIPSVKLEPGHASIQKLIAKSRLVVHSYDSTGILECLASNTPTLCFWNGGLEHLLPNEKPYYELLREAGIIADSPEHASLLVSKYWDDIDGWWKSERVQNARMQFCNQYARVEKKPVMAIKRLLCFYSGCGS